MHFATHALCNMCTLQLVHFATYALCNKCTLQGRPVGQTSCMDQLDRPAGQISWTDQFFIFEALAILDTQRLLFQFVHCRSFRVRQRPWLIMNASISSAQAQAIQRVKGKGLSEFFPTFFISIMTSLLLRNASLHKYCACFIDESPE